MKYYEVMRKDVIVEVPKSAKTPTQTIRGQIYTHSHDSKAGRGKEHIFYSIGMEGVWGLADNKLSGIVDSMSDDDAGFPEGKAILEKHLYRERNSNLIKRAKKRFEKDHNNRVFCEACGFDFGEVYGDVGKNFIEAHHMKPISEMKEGDKTQIEDMAMLCSNCHRMVHRIRPWIFDKNELKSIIRACQNKTA